MKIADAFVESLRPEIKSLPAYNSGLSAEFVKSRYDVARVAKLGSNENPWGPSASVVEAVRQAAAEIALYPDAGSDSLRNALSVLLNVAPVRLAFGNGSEDLISICGHCFLAPGDEIVTITPSFGLHMIYPQAAGAVVRAVPVREDYSIDIPGIIAALTPKTRMVMFSSPSNPVGTMIGAVELQLLLSALDKHTLLIFDEAYFEYAASDPSYPDFLAILEKSDTAWILLRTFSKAYGLAGLRVGYAVAPNATLVNVIDRARTPFNVNRLAQAAALAALEGQEHVRTCVSQTIAERERMRKVLVERGYTVAPSVANFLFFHARENASALAERLLPYGVIVKPWKEAGFSDHVRVSVGLPASNDQFLAALSATSRHR